MKTIYGAVKENGKVKRRIIVLGERKCNICKDMFTPKKQASKYCSKKCSKKADYEKHKNEIREKQKKYYLENVESIKKNHKKYYIENRDKAIEYSKQWRLNNRDKAKHTTDTYHDKIRHGGLKSELVETLGLKCSNCRKEGNTFEIIAHHITGDNTEHEHQDLLCRACHMKLHGIQANPSLYLRFTKEDVAKAIDSTKRLKDAQEKLGVSKTGLYRLRKHYDL